MNNRQLKRPGPGSEDCVVAIDQGVHSVNTQQVKQKETTGIWYYPNGMTTWTALSLVLPVPRFNQSTYPVVHTHKLYPQD